MTGTVISFVNDKGGVAKSTSSACLCDYLLRKGHKVALVDVDPRHSCLDWAEVADQNGYQTPYLTGMTHANVGTEILKLREMMDYVVVDGMSSFVQSSRAPIIAAILKASDYVFIPSQANKFDLWALAEVTDLIKTRQEIADGKPVTHIFGSQVRQTQEWKEFLAHKEEAPFPIMSAYLPHSVDFPRTTGEGRTPLALPDSNKSKTALLGWAQEIEDIIHGE